MYISANKTEGLVHVSQIRLSKVRLEKASDADYNRGDKVFVKVTQIRKDGKISLSMKECCQETGDDLNPRPGTLPTESQSKDHRIIQSIQSQNQKDGFGSITGILLDTTESIRKGQKEVDPDSLWLKSRF